MKTLNYFWIFLERVEGKNENFAIFGKNIVMWGFFVVLWHHFAKYVQCVKKFGVPPNKHGGCVYVLCALCVVYVWFLQ